MVMCSKAFDYDHSQNFNMAIVKISTKTTAKIQLFHSQNGQFKILPRNLTTKIPILTMSMTELQISCGQ